MIRLKTNYGDVIDAKDLAEVKFNFTYTYTPGDMDLNKAALIDEYNDRLEACDTLEEIVDIINEYKDISCSGTQWYVE